MRSRNVTLSFLSLWFLGTACSEHKVPETHAVPRQFCAAPAEGRSPAGEGSAAGRVISACGLRLEKAQQTRLDYVYVDTSNRVQKGGTGEVTVEVAPSRDGEVRIALPEGRLSGTGDQWRSSIWMASFVATSLLGVQLGDYEVRVETRQNIDGPSAGALLAATQLALMTGQDTALRRPLVTMSGTINPDGSIGPVGGLAKKLVAAVAAGKKELGIPNGQRTVQDRSTTSNTEEARSVDMYDLGSEQGIKVHELRDIFDAYRLLTGKTLKRPNALSIMDMDLADNATHSLRKLTRRWLEKAKRIRETDLDDNAVPQLRDSLKRGDDLYIESVDLYQQGLFSAAYTLSAQSAAWMQLLQRVNSVWPKLRNNQYALALGSLRQMMSERPVQQKWQATLERLNAGTPKRILGVLTRVRALSNAMTSYGWLSYSRHNIDLLDKRIQDHTLTPTDAQVLILKAILSYEMADLGLEETDMLSGVEETTGEQERVIDPAVLSRVAKSYVSAADASLKYYEMSNSALLQTARNGHDDWGVLERYEQSKAILAYAVSNTSESNSQGEKAPSLSTSLTNIAAAMSAYINASVLITTDGFVDHIVHAQNRTLVPKAFSDMLDFAELRARETAGQLKDDIGGVSLSARASYQLARTLRDGNLPRKYEALSSYWWASSFSQLGHLLHRLLPTTAKP